MGRIILACALAGVLAVPAFGQGVDPLIGTWKLNLEKSTFTGRVPQKVGPPLGPGKDKISRLPLRVWKPTVSHSNSYLGISTMDSLTRQLALPIMTQISTIELETAQTASGSKMEKWWNSLRPNSFLARLIQLLVRASTLTVSRTARLMCSTGNKGGLHVLHHRYPRGHFRHAGESR
jgi:hypothetical protein